MRAFHDPFFETSDRPVRIRLCDHPGCGQPGLYRAPKSRKNLNEYYYFCLEHVKAYNKAWDYFAGLSPDEIEGYMRHATVWERPSWPLGACGGELRQKALHDIFGESEPKVAKDALPAASLAEIEALAVLELDRPVNFATIKRRYRVLVKRHHPDAHGGSKNDEKFKDISLAFATLRKIYAPVKD